MNLPIQLSERTIKALTENGITEPFEIQSLTALPVYEREDVKIHAPTGSGKTLSYLLPLICRLEENQQENLIILSSSPELASQIHNVCKIYSDLSSLLLLGAANIQRQKDRLKKKPRILVGTPGRVFELFCLERFSVTGNSLLVLDEVDTLLEGTSFDKVLSIAEGCGQLITASATYGEIADDFISECPFELTSISTGKREGTVNHAYVFCNPDKKDISLIKLLREKKLRRVLLFINDLKYSRHLINRLKDEGISYGRLDSKVKKLDREKAVKEFHDGRVQVLVTSDSLARGIDFEDANVIQYNIARDADIYLHRSGRAGRAGKTGTCVSMITPKNAYLIKKLSKKLSITIEEIKFSSGRKKPVKVQKKHSKKKHPSRKKKRSE